MKRLHHNHDGSVISDGEAEEAWDNLCDVFRTLSKWDREEKEEEKQAALAKENDELVNHLTTVRTI